MAGVKYSDENGFYFCPLCNRGGIGTLSASADNNYSTLK